MSAVENIARAIAQRFAPELGDRLPRAVERALADARGEETPFKSVDPAQLIALASFAVSAASLAWTVHMGLWQQRQAAGDVEKLKKENEILKNLLVARLDAEAARPAQLESGQRTRMLEAAADEAIAEAARREDRG